jgi:ankyrin repeat protein
MHENRKIPRQKPLKLAVFLLMTVWVFSPSSLAAQYQPGNVFSAARGGNVKEVEQFIQSEVPQETLNQILAAAVAGDQIDIVELLIKRGAQVNQISSFNTNLLINAIMSNKFRCAEVLIKAGAEIDSRGYQRMERGLALYWNWTPLMCAAYKGNESLVKLLISKGADIKAAGWSKDENTWETAADIAAYSGHLKILQFLQKKGASLSPDIIFQIVSAGHADVAKALINKEKDINKNGPYGKTLLMEASWWGHADLVKYLLQRGADPNAVGPNGYTALGEAAGNAFESDEKIFEVVRLLIDHGADVNLAGHFKMTPLMRAIESKHKKVTEYLEAHDAH